MSSDLTFKDTDYYNFCNKGISTAFFSKQRRQRAREFNHIKKQTNKQKKTTPWSLGFYHFRFCVFLQKLLFGWSLQEEPALWANSSSWQQPKLDIALIPPVRWKTKQLKVLGRYQEFRFQQAVFKCLHHTNIVKSRNSMKSCMMWA